MDLINIVAESLKEQGFDGLFHEECGCELNDLMRCFAPCLDCTAGFKNTHSDGVTWVISNAKDLTDEQIMNIADV